MQIVWSPLAEQDIINAFTYILNENPVVAVHVIDRIESGVEHLRLHPEMGRKGQIKGTRELIIPRTPYIVIYRVLPNVIEVAALIHGSRQWPDNV